MPQNAVPALIVPHAGRFHAELSCYSPLKTTGVVTDASMLTAQGKKPCRRCWNPRGYQFTRDPEIWEVRQYLQAEEGVAAAAD